MTKLRRGLFPILLLMLTMAYSHAQATFQVAPHKHSKPIRQRTETLDPAAPENRSPRAASAKHTAPASGLYLIPFTGPLEPARRTHLRAAGVEELKYVPDDAFIARFTNASPASIAAHSFVTWIAPYRPEHKIHPRLAANLQAATNATQTVTVSLLLAASATPAEIAVVRSLLKSVQAESHLRQGTFIKGDLSPKQLDALAQSGAVLWIENAPRHKLVDEAAAKLVGGDDGQVATPTVTEQEGIHWHQCRGLRG